MDIIKLQNVTTGLGTEQLTKFVNAAAIYDYWYDASKNKTFIGVSNSALILMDGDTTKQLTCILTSLNNGKVSTL